MYHILYDTMYLIRYRFIHTISCCRFGSSDSESGDVSFERRRPRRSGSTRALSRDRYTVPSTRTPDDNSAPPPHARSASVPSVSDMIKKAEKKIEAQTAHHVRQVSSGSVRGREGRWGEGGEGDIYLH